jgi:hypothetical protein
LNIRWPKKISLFHNFESEIGIQVLNGNDMGRIVYSSNARINILNDIGDEIRTNLAKIIMLNSNISLIIDELSMPSKILWHVC